MAVWLAYFFMELLIMVQWWMEFMEEKEMSSLETLIRHFGYHCFSRFRVRYVSPQMLHGLDPLLSEPI